jgi:methyl-accepting chemotaxis protein
LRVAEGATLSKKAGDALATIVSGVDSTAQGILKITSATSELTSAAGEVNQAIDKVTHITESNALAAQELASSSEELDAQANGLQMLVKHFTVSDAASGHSKTSKGSQVRPAPLPLPPTNNGYSTAQHPSLN